MRAAHPSILVFLPSLHLQWAQLTSTYGKVGFLHFHILSRIEHSCGLQVHLLAISVVWVGDLVRKGQEIGYFKFGGSTAGLFFSAKGAQGMFVSSILIIHDSQSSTIQFIIVPLYSASPNRARCSRDEICRRSCGYFA
jgi:hypothetical protein